MNDRQPLSSLKRPVALPASQAAMVYLQADIALPIDCLSFPVNMQLHNKNCRACFTVPGMPCWLLNIRDAWTIL